MSWKNCTKTANSQGKNSTKLGFNKSFLCSSSVTQTKIKVDQGRSPSPDGLLIKAIWINTWQIMSIFCWLLKHAASIKFVLICMRLSKKVRSWNLSVGCALWAFSAISDPWRLMKHKAIHRQAWPFALAQKKHFFHFTFIKNIFTHFCRKRCSYKWWPSDRGSTQVWIVESIRV